MDGRCYYDISTHKNSVKRMRVFTVVAAAFARKHMREHVSRRSDELPMGFVDAHYMSQATVVV